MASVEVVEEMAAPPWSVWEVVGDPVTMAGLTAECSRMTWGRDVTGPAVGARFKGHNRSGWRRWTTTCTIVRYEPGTEVAWDVRFGPLAVARWSYRVEAGRQPGTTTVTERFDDHRSALLRATGPLVRGTSDAEGLNRTNMETTLARVKARVEA